MNGKSEYCKYCWACYQYVKCIAAPETRKVLCEKAKARMEGQKKQSESRGLKNYLKYIQQRITYLKGIIGEIPTNEYRYYCALQESIKSWGKSHAIYYGLLHEKISIAQAKSMLGVSERELYRQMRNQRKRLIEFIEKQEKLLESKYPFIPMTDIFEE